MRLSFLRRVPGVLLFVCFASTAVHAEEQVWGDGSIDKIWSTNAANWAGGAVWTNGNSAVFSGGNGTVFGETVDIAATVTVANVTFQTNGYVIADANSDGLFSVSGAPGVITVGAGNTGTVSVTVGGSGGVTKAGNGVLSLTKTNTYFGTTTVAAGVLRLQTGVLQSLGATGAGNDTVVAAGATLDFNGCYRDSSTSERFTIAGAGVDGKGAIINTGAGHVNKGLGGLTLSADAAIGGPNRLDVYGTFTGNGFTLTKLGDCELCVNAALNGSPVVISQGSNGKYTLLSNANALGGVTAGDTTLNSGMIFAWGEMSVPERIFVNGGSIGEGDVSRTFKLTGQLTLNSNLVVNSASGRGVELSGLLDGASGFTQGGAGWCVVTCATNTYAGPTTVNGGCPLYVGRTNLYAGVLGTGTVTNNGTLFGYSSLISQGNMVNAGTLYCNTGLLCSGSVENKGSLYIDRGGAFVLGNAFSGAGTLYLRANPFMAVSGSASTNAGLRIGAGSLTLTNSAFFRFTGEIQVADRFVYAVDPTNVTGVINVSTGCTLVAQAITFGNGTNLVNGGMTGVLNQAGGTVVTTGRAAEENGIRLGHYPQAYTIYNMMGGALVVEGDTNDLCCATDGTGWFNMTGGEVFATRVMLNERDYDGGFGQLTVSGGVMNLGSVRGVIPVVSNGIAADRFARYRVDLGGAGAIIRARTNLDVSVSATLFGADADAVTFDTQAWTVTMTNTLAGAGGFNKKGSGTLVLSGSNTFSGAAWVKEGALLLGSESALTSTPVTVLAGASVDLGGLSQRVVSLSGEGLVTNGTLTVAGAIAPGTNGIGTLTLALASAAPGGVLVVEAVTNGTCDVLHATGDLSLDGMALQVLDNGQLNTHQVYTLVRCDGELSGRFSAATVPSPWYLFYEEAADEVQLRSARGTLLRVR